MAFGASVLRAAVFSGGSNVGQPNIAPVDKKQGGKPPRINGYTRRRPELRYFHRAATFAGIRIHSLAPIRKPFGRGSLSKMSR
jgi:hypothetical protein